MSPTSTYTIPLVPAAIVLGALIFLIFVPVFALAVVVVIVVGILSGLAASTVSLLRLTLRWVRSYGGRHHTQQPGLAMEAGLPADAKDDGLREPRPIRLPLSTKGIQ